MTKTMARVAAGTLCAAGLSVLTACTVPVTDDVGQASQAVLNGSTTTIQSMVVVYSDVACGGVVLGPRHVATIQHCTEGSQLMVIQQPPTDGLVDVVEILEGPTMDLNSTQFTPVLLVTTEDLTLPAAPLQTTLPAVDDVVRLVGYGTQGGIDDVATEGDMQVSDLYDNGFMAAGQNGVEGCSIDTGAFDQAGALVGLAVMGGQGTGDCLDPLIFLGASPWEALLEEAGVSGGGGAGTGGAGTGGSGTGAAGTGGVVGGTSTGGAASATDSDDDSGCGCHTVGGGSTSAHWLLPLLALGAGTLARRRRRQG